MSDVERPSSPNRSSPQGSATPPSKNAPVRGMADIAKLFLDGARPVTAHSPPTRRPPPTPPAPVPHTQNAPAAPQIPATRIRQVPCPPIQPANISQERTKSPIAPDESHEQPTADNATTLYLAFALPTSNSTNWHLLSQVAAGLAIEHSTTVGLIGIRADDRGATLALDVAGAEAPDDLPAIYPSNAAPDLQIARALYTLRNTIGIWLIAAPDPEQSSFPAVAGVLRDWLIACPSDNAGLIAAYQHLKRSFLRAPEADSPPAPSVYLLADDAARAAGVHRRLRAAAAEFLKTDLPLAGIADLDSAPPVRLLSLVLTGSHDNIWASILDELAPAPSESEIAESTESDPVEFEAPESPLAQTPIPQKTAPMTPPPAPLPAPKPTTKSVPRKSIPVGDHAVEPLDIETALDNLATSAGDVARSSAAASAVFDHLAQVLDPEERAALIAAFDDPEPEIEVTSAPSPAAEHISPPTPSYDIRSHISAPVTIIAPDSSESAPAKSPGAPALTPALTPEQPGTVTLRAFDLLESRDRSRASQWDSVERSVRDLVPDSILLEARPPMSWASDSCIAIDPDGRLHVWTLYKDGASWYALREWASEHRNLLALTRRDLVLSKEADVVVHIVLPLEDPPVNANNTAKPDPDRTPSIVNTILRTPAKNIHIYRLRILQWNARRGMVVVPIA